MRKKNVLKFTFSSRIWAIEKFYFYTDRMTFVQDEQLDRLWISEI